MSAKKLKTKIEDRSAARDYLRKAEDNFLAMLSALKEGNSNAVGTLAIQCAISSADAVCVKEKGTRSISQDHFDVCELIGSVTLPDAAGKAALLRRNIGKKNLIQYERRNMTASEAEEMAKNVTKFYQWAAGLFIK